MSSILGTWGWPPDGPARIAVGVAAVLAVMAVTRRGPTDLFGRLDERRFLGAAAFAAALASVAYTSIYLRGGPRIIDATTYFLQARAISHGDFAWTTGDPSASFRGRFLVFHDGTLGGIFPPGYPLVLAFGFWIGAPMIIGPVLAAALVVATYRLAQAVATELGLDDEPVARGAALLSILSAALRYHTADTMSHGASALGIVLAFTFALRGAGFATGIAIGYVTATRPVSALPIALVAGALLSRRAFGRAFVGTLPGLLLLVFAQHAVTGAWLTSSQRLYYALSDGPPDCFRFGFGKGIGCSFEHGDFVAARLPHGYGILEALGTTLRRLREHLRDVANLEPLALLVLVPLGRSTRAVRAGGALVGLHVLAYAPFYFDGNYPGGGARFFADVLPVEHVLAIAGAALLAGTRGVDAALAMAALGFAVHASFEHGKLRDRDGGRPMFEPDVLARASVKTGLVFVDTDHGFALGHDPGARPDRGLVVARLREDARDRMLFDALDRPPTWLYRFDPAKGPTLVPWAPPDHELELRFEAEAEWPPLFQRGGHAVPAWVDGCASGARALMLTPAAAHALATIALPVPTAGRYIVEVHVVGPPSPAPRAEAAITIGPERWAWRPDGRCSKLAPREIDLAPPFVPVTLEATNGPALVDRITLLHLSPSPRGNRAPPPVPR